MADRTIVLAQNGRHSVRGLSVITPQEFRAYQDKDDALTYTIDYTAYLDGATISSVTRTATGTTVTGTSNTTTKIIQRLSGFGYVDISATLSSGDTDVLRICIIPRLANSRARDNYNWINGLG